MTQINRSRKDTLPHLSFWNAKNTQWWGKPVVRSFKLIWADVWRLCSLMTFSTNPKYFLLFMSSYGLPLLASGSPISFPSLMHSLSPDISRDQIPLLQVREWDYFLLRLLFLFPLCCQLLQSSVFFLKASGAGIVRVCKNFQLPSRIKSWSQRRVWNVFTENTEQQKINTHNNPLFV